MTYLKHLKKVAFQGELGAYSHLALKSVFDNSTPLAALNFKQAMTLVSNGDADAAMIPVENSQWGRVSDVHFLLAKTDLYITAEIFYPIQHQLVAIKQTNLNNITHVHSHPQALGQCIGKIEALGLTPLSAYDTAGSAKNIAQLNDKTQAAIASKLAAEIYGLQILQSDFHDKSHNTTRFIVMQKKEKAHLEASPTSTQTLMTAFLFTTKNIPAALYKVMGGFATNNVNMIRLESYVNADNFTSSSFYAEIVGSPDDKDVQYAFKELEFFATDFKILGIFYADKFRENL